MPECSASPKPNNLNTPSVCSKVCPQADAAELLQEICGDGPAGIDAAAGSSTPGADGVAEGSDAPMPPFGYGMAGSSGDAVTPPPASVPDLVAVAPPPPPPIPDDASAKFRTTALVSIKFVAGRIRVYKDGRFEALCCLPGHVSCRMTRYLPKSERAARSGKGRPVGHMAAWLSPSIELHDTAEHRNPFFMMSISKEARQKARNDVKAVAHGLALLSKERARLPDEDSEPEGCS